MIYKYVGPGDLDKVFVSDENATLKCTYPKDFNDPYELFLTIDFTERPEVLAFYSEVIGELPQLPTICFSRSPAIVPMWANYAQSCSGFVIEFDEVELAASFPENGFGDMDYIDNPSDSIRKMLYRAYEIGKPRYIYLLQQLVFSNAYYCKSSYWSYEIERRMIVNAMDTRQQDEVILLDVPNDTIKSIICGPRTIAETSQILQERAQFIGCAFFEMRIGRNSSVPYFSDSVGNPYVFDNGNLSPSSSCVGCQEPIAAEADYCSWCLIEDADREDAADRNVYRMMQKAGLLESYLEDMAKIGREEIDD